MNELRPTWPMLWPLPLMMTLSLLSGCVTTSGPCSAIPLIEYDNAFKDKLASEIFSAGPTVRRFTRESIQLRDAVRACKGAK
jgi:hypothetical protein